MTDRLEEIRRIQLHPHPNKATQDDFDWLIAEIDRLRAERRWVPVGQRLPKESANFLAVIIAEDALETPLVLHLWYDGDGRWYDLRGDEEKVTHWQPLPPPPEEG